MKFLHAVSVCLAAGLMLAAQAVRADSPSVPAAFVGNWKATWAGKTKPIDAEMTLNEAGGRWQSYNVASSTNACYGRAVPIVVQSATDDAVTLKLKFSEIVDNCTDVTVKMQRQPDGSITGTRSGEPLTLVKK